MSVNSCWKLLLLLVLVTAELSNSHEETSTQKIDDKMKYRVRLGSPEIGKAKRQVAYEPFRVTPYYDQSVNDKNRDVRSRIQDMIIPSIQEFLNRTLMVQPLNSPVLIDRDCEDGLFFPGNGPSIQCAYSCASITRCGVVNIPEDHLKACTQCNGSISTCEQVGTNGTGVSDTDFLLYVASLNTQTCASGSPGRNSPSTIAFATACALEADLDRPIAGYVNFCPSAMESSEVDDEFLFTVTKHELLHALAFTSSLYPFWRDENGNPRTERDENGFPPRDNTANSFITGNTTVEMITYTDWLDTNGNEVVKNVAQLVTPNVVAEGRQHFNCSTLSGVELEDSGGMGTALSHWEKRILGNEAMTGILTDSPVFSRLTLAVLEDSGWYQVNYSNGGILLWGKNAGCIFATRSCQEYILDQINNSQSISPFCSPIGSTGCTIARESIGLCSTFELADSCPVVLQASNRDCTNPANSIEDAQNIYVQSYGSCSRCFNHGEREWSNPQTRAAGGTAGCYQYLCSDEEVTVYIGDDGAYYNCSSAGQVISVSVEVQGIGETTGSIVCPSYEEICFDFDPQENCPELDNTDGTGRPNSGTRALLSSFNICLMIMLFALI